MDYRIIIEVNCHWKTHTIWSFYVQLVRWFQPREMFPGAWQWFAPTISLYVTFMGYAQANGANCYCSRRSPFCISPTSCLHVMSIVFLCFGLYTFCSAHIFFNCCLKKKKKKVTASGVWQPWLLLSAQAGFCFSSHRIKWFKKKNPQRSGLAF